MRNFLLLTIIAVTINLGINQLSFAVCGEGPANNFTCNTDPPNPDLNGIQEGINDNNLMIDMLPGFIIDTTAAGTPAVDAGDGNNLVNMHHATVIALDGDGFDIENGGNTFSVNDSEIRCDDDCIDLGNGNDDISLFRSIVMSLDNEGIRTGGGNDVIMAVDSEILGGTQCCNNFGIQMGGGDDQITIINTRVAGFIDMGTPFAIRMSSEDDIVTLGTGARIEGLIACGTGFDTIVFAMEVPLDQKEIISAEIASKNPAADSITINGLFYEWEECEELVADLQDPKQIPTLSEWGLIAMAGILGIVGFMVMRRRKVTA